MSEGAQQARTYEANATEPNGNGGAPRPRMTFEDIARGFAQAMIHVGAGWNVPCSVQVPDPNTGVVSEQFITPAQLIMNLTVALQESRDATDDLIDIMSEAGEEAEAEEVEEPKKKRKRRK